MLTTSWPKDWTVGVRVWVDRRGQTVLGEGRADLLDAIAQHRSITAAAKAIGMSYRKAWSLIQEVNEAAGEPLVEAAVGGLQGGGARLTDRGALAVKVFRELQDALQEGAAGALRRVAAPAQDDGATSCVHVAAAISLQEALGQIVAAFALHRPAVAVRVVYGASNELASHLIAGAPGDLFISAEPAQIDELEAAGRVLPGTRRVVASNSLAVIGSKGRVPIAGLAGLANSAVKRIALADPACPLGRYSRDYLQRAGAYDSLLPKVMHVDNSRAVLSAVASGAAGAGLAFSSDAQRSGEYQLMFRVPRAKAAASYVAALLDNAAPSGDAGELLDFLSSPVAERCFRRCGLRPAMKQ
jgi:molybdate transport system substrate-binding protein